MRVWTAVVIMRRHQACPLIRLSTSRRYTTASLARCLLRRWRERQHRRMGLPTAFAGVAHPVARGAARGANGRRMVRQLRRCVAGVGAKSAGRGGGGATRLSWQSGGQGFESPQLHPTSHSRAAGSATVSVAGQPVAQRTPRRRRERQDVKAMEPHRPAWCEPVRP